MKALIKEYLEDQKMAWAETTIKSETTRLNSVADQLDKAPSDLHRDLLLAGRKPYSIKTLFIRLVALERWGIENGRLTEARFKKYMTKHRNKFKHAYQKEDIEMTYEDALARIHKLDEPSRLMALSLLETGLRMFEAYKAKDGKVIGKGGKARPVYGTIAETVPRSTFSRHLKSVGLKPHTLRKLLATRLVELGATPADLCKVFGWSSISTAYQYLLPKDNSKLYALVQEAKTKNQGA